MQNVRRERPWSTSKNTTKQSRTRTYKRPSSKTTYAQDSKVMPTAATSSSLTPVGYPNHVTAIQASSLVVTKKTLCLECHAVLCCLGQSSCPDCVQPELPTPGADSDNRLFDPFQTFSVDIDGTVSELLEHCECTSSQLVRLRQILKRVMSPLFRDKPRSFCYRDGPWHHRN